MKVHIADDGGVKIDDFNAIQAFKIARKLEADGIDFYRKVAAGTSDEKIKNAVVFLLEGEEKHLNFFESCLESIKSTHEDNFEQDDIADYIETPVFKFNADLEKIESELSNPIRVVELGKAIEKRAIAFYSALMKNTNDDEAKAALSDIMEEERKHLELFNRMA